MRDDIQHKTPESTVKYKDKCGEDNERSNIETKSNNDSWETVTVTQY
jgi:hypothetical protein